MLRSTAKRLAGVNPQNPPKKEFCIIQGNLDTYKADIQLHS